MSPLAVAFGIVICGCLVVAYVIGKAWSQPGLDRLDDNYVPDQADAEYQDR